MCVKFDKEFFRQFTSDEEFNQIVDIDNVVKLLKLAYRKYANCPAVIDNSGNTHTFKQLFNDVSKVSSFFKQNNILKQNIGLYCPNGYDFEVMSLGIMASGNTVCLLPYSFNKQMLEQYVQTLDITKLITDKDDISFVETISPSYLFRFDPLLNPFDNEIDKDDSAAILLTGGTTGLPKGAILSHDNLMAGTINGCYGLKNIFKQKYYCLLPLTHSFGFIRNMLTAIYTGSCIYYNQDKQQLFKELTIEKPSVLVIVPALAELFLKLVKGAGPQVLGGNVHTIISGAANVPPYLAQEYSKLGIVFCPGYGLTECSNIVTGNPYADKYSDSVGVLFPDQEAKIVDGELYLKGRTLFKGYYKNEIETNKVMSDGWIKTGDLAKFDENNFLYILGRIKDIIVLPNGENISPAYIESKICTLDLIQDSLVYDEVNEFGNTQLIAELTIRPVVLNKLGLKPEEIKPYIQKHIDKVNENLLSYEHIDKIVIRDKDFDRSPAMKIIRKKH